MNNQELIIMNSLQILPNVANNIIFDYVKGYNFLDEYYHRLKDGNEINNTHLKDIKAVQLLGVITSLSPPEELSSPYNLPEIFYHNRREEFICWRKTTLGFKRVELPWYYDRRTRKITYIIKKRTLFEL